MSKCLVLTQNGTILCKTKGHLKGHHSPVLRIGRAKGRIRVISTVNDRYSRDRFSGNDGFSGTKTPDDAILFTVSGITVLVELFLENFGTFCQFSYIFYAKSNDF